MAARKKPHLNALPRELVSREALDELRRRIEATGIKVQGPEPQWEAIRRSLITDRGLSPSAARESIQAMERLWLLPFHRYDTCAPVLLFYFAELPTAEARFHKDNDDDGLTLCNALRVLTEMMIQGVSLFPGEPHYIGGQLVAAIQSPAPESRRYILPLSRLLAAHSDGICGLNHYRAEDPNLIALYEHLSRRGQYETVVKNNHRYEAYEDQLQNDPRFWKEWEQLRADFHSQLPWDTTGIVRRSPLAERNWEQDGLPNLKNPAERFQSAFDVFCWKWFLYGMQQTEQGERPLVQKIIHTVSPYGTTLFIPGYWSFDAARDIDWKTLGALHRARGVRRQGEKQNANRKQSLAQAKRAQAANIEAKAQGLQGAKRYDFIKIKSGLSLDTDDAHVRRLLKIPATPAEM